tara:strand:+ start:2919 stop:3551 length:633 start_codon:yes stop_codon:yes gene_type:complete
MARKKGIVKQISKYGENHPYVTLALAGTFGYYFYENMVKPRMAPEEKPDMRYAVQGIGMTTSTSTTTSSSHIPNLRGEGSGEPSMHIPEGSGLFGRRNPPAHLMYDEVQRGGKELPGMMGLGSHCNGLGSHCNARGNPHCHCGGGMAGFSPSARRRVGHSGMGMATESYEPTLDTQFSNQEAMVMGDLKKHEDILGFSGLMPLQGGDWHE